MNRCMECFAKVDTAHEILGHCPYVQPDSSKGKKKSPTINRQRNPLSREEYLSKVCRTREEKLAVRRLKQARYRARKKGLDSTLEPTTSPG